MSLFSPTTVGDVDVRNRVSLAPMTRLRASADGVPGHLIATYYAQRAGIGLLVTEGVFPSAESRAYPGQPGIVTDAQAAGWAKVADAVHAEGGAVFMQLILQDREGVVTGVGAGAGASGE
ncbi:hypothetical protein [Microbacterium enclense]|uniref:oxidoreductase n=1 Tax=Microbacterium enclense TaxID=993073 RepID=UPI001F0C0685|nr:hypothetical protein [Microbacterium enclense]